MRSFLSMIVLSLSVFCSCKKSGDKLDKSVYIEEEDLFSFAQKDRIQQGFVLNQKEDVTPYKISTNNTASRFFGNFDEADTIAFVLDFSGSMDGERVDILKRELASCLKSLNSEVSYSVINFSDTGWFLGKQKGWVRATTQNVKKTIKSLENQYVGGGTEWKSGFKIAFSLNPRPEVIYFMTDGETNSDMTDEVDSITHQNQSHFYPSRIHTTALVQKGLSQPLIRLAAKNEGQFTWVNAQGEVTKK
mgnify:CR=1 FL=1